MPRSSAPSRKRREALTGLLSTRNQVSTAELAGHFGVSEMTIRRDLKALEQQGVAVSCYGGAMAAQRITFEFAFDERRRRNLDRKQRIGAFAAGLVEPGQIVFLDTGTTTLEAARALVKQQVECDIITGSLVIASELWGQSRIGLRLLGGRVRTGNPDLTGPYSESMLDRFSADIAFLGSEGVHPERGVFAADTETARIGERMAHNAQRTIVLTDATKIGAAGPVRYLQTNEVDELITDRAADRSAVARLRRSGVNVKLV